MQDPMTIERTYALEVYPKREIVITRGESARLYDINEKEYIDCTSGMGVANVGHANKDVANAIHEQAKKLITCPGIFYNDVRAKLIEKLVALSPASLTRVFLCNSGTEAIEAAIKFALYTTKKRTIICMMRGYHGRTLGALSATHKATYKKDFPLIAGFTHIPFNNIGALHDAITDDTAAVLLEVVQGEGGVIVADEVYLREAEALCKEKNVLLIIDEIQTGFGRTGKMFACEHAGIQPDIICLAKAIGGGVPMGAVLCSDRVHIDIGKHGTTFGGNPLACAASLATISYLEEHDLVQRAHELGNYFVASLHAHNLPIIREIRHKGLMIGIELKTRAQPYLEKLIDQGILALPAGSTVIRLLPPLVITKEELNRVLKEIIITLSH